MLYRDWRFLSALGFTVGQQVLLAFSTYYIAQAGLLLESGDIQKILFYVSLFFVFALLGYVSSSVATFCSTRASNEAWRQYVTATLICSTESLQQASDKNKKTITQWLGGEAMSTISYACSFYLGFTSVALNVVLTLLVFFLSVGWAITLAMATSLAISLIFVMVLRNKIESLAGEMQDCRLRALLANEITWNSAMFGSRIMRDAGFRELDEKHRSYFGVLNKYVLLEQVVACFPIVISTIALVVLIQYSSIFTLGVVGTLVAILPRSLQVFGSVHSLSIYLSQFYMIRTKLRNLKGFSSRLDTFHLMNMASLKDIAVFDAGASKEITPEELLKKLQSGNILNGRYTVTGNNGSGKSSFLKIIKGALNDSLLMTPETNFLDLSSDFSTGQVRIQEINTVLSCPPAVLMLDEWDANLDDENYRKIDSVLGRASRDIVIIEVRHLRQSQAA